MKIFPWGIVPSPVGLGIKKAIYTICPDGNLKQYYKNKDKGARRIKNKLEKVAKQEIKLSERHTKQVMEKLCLKWEYIHL